MLQKPQGLKILWKKGVLCLFFLPFWLVTNCDSEQSEKAPSREKNPSEGQLWPNGWDGLEDFSEAFTIEDLS